MLDIWSTMDLIEAKPEYENAVRCMIDLSLSKPSEKFWVVVPGKFVSEGKPKDCTTEEWFEEYVIGAVYGDSIPKEWLLLGVLHKEYASDDEIVEAFTFINDRNMSLIED